VVRGLFVTGTDTSVGKTVVSAALLLRYRGEVPLRYWKPIQTGIEQDDDTADVARLAACRPDEVMETGVGLRRPLSPHLAARLSGVTIEMQPFIDFVKRSTHGLIVEGAGGALVPINDTDLMADLMHGLGLPAVVVARSSLGTINHTLLTLDALRRRSIGIAGVVMVGVPDADNREAIERYGCVSVLGEMPFFDPLTPDALAAWAAEGLDREGRLHELLGSVRKMTQ
jgi:dethiobiotin synthetase